jgi:hypothetical protein
VLTPGPSAEPGRSLRGLQAGHRADRRRTMPDLLGTLAAQDPGPSHQSRRHTDRPARLAGRLRRQSRRPPPPQPRPRDAHQTRKTVGRATPPPSWPTCDGGPGCDWTPQQQRRGASATLLASVAADVPLARALEDFLTTHQLAIPPDWEERRAAQRRHRRIDAVPEPLRPAVAGFVEHLVAGRDRARRTGTQPRAHATIDARLAAVRDLAQFLTTPLRQIRLGHRRGRRHRGVPAPPHPTSPTPFATRITQVPGSDRQRHPAGRDARGPARGPRRSARDALRHRSNRRNQDLSSTGA